MGVVHTNINREHSLCSLCIHSHSLTFSLSSEQAIPKLPFKVSQIPTHSNSIQTLPSSVRRRQSHEPGRGTDLNLLYFICVCLTVCPALTPPPPSLSLRAHYAPGTFFSPDVPLKEVLQHGFVATVATQHTAT